jgi:hypothetical protein
MAKTKTNTNPKKKNRFSDQGVLHPGIKKVRKARVKLMAAARSGAPEEELQKLRLELKKLKALGKEGKAAKEEKD